MAFRSFQVLPAYQTATLVYQAVPGDVEVDLHVPVGAVFLGGDNSVTDTNGYKVETARTNHLKTRVRPGDELWVYNAQGPGTQVHVLVRSA